MAALAITGTLTSCMTCMAAIESLKRQEPAAPSVTTFVGFVFVAIYGFTATSKCFRVKRVIPLRTYAPLVVLFCSSSILATFALNFNVPVPLHIVLRSGSLITSLILDVFWLKKTYRLRKYASVFAVTAGISLCTLASTNALARHSDDSTQLYEMLFGVLCSVVGLFVLSLLSIKQHELLRAHKHLTDEVQFIMHVYSLPLFAPLLPAIWKTLAAMSRSSPLVFLGVALGPRQLCELLAVGVSQVFCISCIYRLQGSMEPLATVFVLTLRKFLSVLFSIFYFQNAFTLAHWIGTLLVFGGSVLFDDNVYDFVLCRRGRCLVKD